MRKLFLIAISIISITSAQGQWLAEGTVINNFQMTDINSQVIDAYQTTATGKHIIIDFSATWCSNCLNYHNSKVLEDYYKAYGPNGTIAQDAQVVFYESDFSTDNNDLTGVGTNTIADWTQGVTHPICNEAQPSNVYHKFLANPGNIGYPSVVVLCENNRYYKISTSVIQVAALRTLIMDKCSSTPLNTSSIQNDVINFTVSPNPSFGLLNVKYELKEVSDFSLEIVSLTGKSVYKSENKSQSPGAHVQKISELNVAAGLYFVRFNVNGRMTNKKILLDNL